MSKKKLSLKDLKIDSFVPVLDERLASVKGGAPLTTLVGCTSGFNCNSEYGGPNSGLPCCPALPTSMGCDTSEQACSGTDRYSAIACCNY